MNMKLTCILVVGLGLYESVLSAHDRPVHRAITVNAAASAFDESPAYAGFLTMVSSDCSLFTATNSMVEGSAQEDNVDTDAGGKRS